MIIGIGLTSFTVPTARLIMPSLLQIDDWHAFYLYELGMCLIAWAAVQLVKLPPSEKTRVFERLGLCHLRPVRTGGGLALRCSGPGPHRLVDRGGMDRLGPDRIDRSADGRHYDRT